MEPRKCFYSLLLIMDAGYEKTVLKTYESLVRGFGRTVCSTSGNSCYGKRPVMVTGVFQWLTSASRPLSLKEIGLAARIDIDDSIMKSPLNAKCIKVLSECCRPPIQSNE